MLDCQCPRSLEPCWRQARVIDALSRAVCHVCHQGCGELRFGAPSEIFVMTRVVAAHEPLVMGYAGR